MADTLIISPGAQVLLYYCEADATEHDMLVAGLDQLRDEGVISTWADQNISTIEPDRQSGQDAAALFTVAVVLLSPEFVASGGCSQDGIQSALRETDNAALITVLIRPVESDDPTVSELMDRVLVPQPLSAIDDPSSLANDLNSAIRDACQHQLRTQDGSHVGNLDHQLPLSEAPTADAYKHGSSSRKTKDPIPERIGQKFKVKRVLGEGGFGRVYLAEDEKLQRLVAIKVAHRRRISYPSDIKAYEREAQLVAQLDHPNIVPVLEVGTDEHQFYVVSRYIAGRNLAQVLRESRPPFYKTAEIVATVAEALHHAHQHELHIVHRDVKPANILIDKDGRPYVADFGLAIREEESHEHLKLAGTPAYMSPEQARCEGHRIDGRSDVFSLGVVMYELLTGEHPFRKGKREDIRQLLNRITTAEVWPPRQRDYSIPMPLEEYCLKAMANRLSERYTNAKDFADDLWYYLEGEQSTSTHDDRRGSGGSGDWRVRRSHSTDMRSESSARVSGSARVTGSAHTSGRQRSHSSRDLGSRRRDTTHASSRSGSRVQVEHPAEDGAAEEIKIIPKGLRAFDQDDADFFLELLPGVRDRYHIPESIRFWKRKIETFEAHETFRVGVIYGPSGCGKTSLVRAGLLPLLDERVHPVIFDATAKGTQDQLAERLARLCSNAPERADLPETVGWIRRGRAIAPEHKLLIVIDQFEQWLQACEESDTLLNALRQCDGARVQCLLMVRDDFIMGIRRFMNDLDVPLQEGTNTAAVDLFDPLHARNVLKSFGISYGLLPENDQELSHANNEFLDGAIEELKVDNRIVPVHLALLTDMCKGREWKRDTLQTFGGTRGIGEAFLQDTFEHLQHRPYEQPARAVLKSLLPLPRSRIRDQTRSRTEMAKTSGFDIESKEFAELLSILDHGTRLITPVEGSAGSATGEETNEAGADASASVYQLTHDYLVPSLRQWLTRKQKETARGRAEIRLEELSLLWNDKPESRRLPGFFEWLRIRTLTQRSDWSPPERKMMKVATRRALINAAIAATLALAAVFGLRYQRQQQITQVVNTEIEKLPTAITSEVPSIVSRLSDTPDLSKSLLGKEYPGHSQKDLGRLNTSIALLALGPRDEGAEDLLEYVYERLQVASPSEVRGIHESLAGNQELLLDRVRADVVPNATNALPLASIFAAYDPAYQWPTEMTQLVARQLVDEPTDSAGGWRENLHPVQAQLREPLQEIFISVDSADPRQLQRHIAAGDLLVAFAPEKAEDRIPFLVDLIPDSSDADLFNRIASLLAPHPDAAHQALAEQLTRLDEELVQIAEQLAQLDEELAQAVQLESEMAELVEDAAGKFRDQSEARKRQMYTVAAILKLGGTEDAWRRFEHSEDPTLRSLLIRHLASLGSDVSVITARLKSEPDVTIRRALCLALAEYPQAAVSDLQIAEFAKAFESAKQHPDAGLHAAADFVSRVWIGRGMIINPTEPGPDAKPGRDEETALAELDKISPTWYRSATGREMVAIHGPVTFKMGSPVTDPDREEGPEGTFETQHQVEIPRSFAVAAKEVTVLEFVLAWQEFWEQHPEFHKQKEIETEQGKLFVDNRGSPYSARFRVSPVLECPINGVSWFHAAAYCNWLSKQERIPKNQWCYPNDQRFDDQMTLPEDYLRRRGYRLPTEAEWEYVCRAGSTTSRFYGEGTSLLSSYAWHRPNADHISHPVGQLKPNDFGLFDILGNIEEWCQDRVRSFKAAPFVDRVSKEEKVDQQFNRIHRGGAFEYVTHRVCSAARDRSDPDYGYFLLGFRVARTLPVEAD